MLAAVMPYIRPRKFPEIEFNYQRMRRFVKPYLSRWRLTETVCIARL